MLSSRLTGERIPALPLAIVSQTLQAIGNFVCSISRALRRVPSRSHLLTQSDASPALGFARRFLLRGTVYGFC